MSYTVTRYTIGYEPLSAQYATLEDAKNAISNVSKSKRKNKSIYTIDKDDTTIEVVAETDGFVPPNNVLQPNDSHPDKIWMNIDEIPEIFGDDINERFNRWMNFYNNGIIFYSDN